MADRIILDFENEVITWNTDGQKGTEIYIGLKEKKEAILKAMGYEVVDFSSIVHNINEYINGGISQEELLNKMEEFENK